MWESLLLLAAVLSNRDTGSNPELMRLLDRTVWVDIGVGRDLASLTPKEAAELKRCKEPAMAFRKEPGGWVQSFYAGMELRTVYASAVLRNDSTRKTVLFYTTAGGIPAETLRLSHSGDVAEEQTRGFRPRIFVKCN